MQEKLKIKWKYFVIIDVSPKLLKLLKIDSGPMVSFKIIFLISTYLYAIKLI